MTNFLIFAMLLAPAVEPSFEEAVKLSQKRNYEDSEKILSTIKPTEDIYNKYIFYRMINCYCLGLKEEGIKHATAIEHSFIEVPIRYRDMAILLKADMETWISSPEDLDDISREMRKVGDRLESSKAGPKTQEIQKEIAKRLANIIKKLEDDKNKMMMQTDQRKVPDRVQPPPEAPPGGERGTGEVVKKRLREVVEIWGKLPEKERAAAIRGIIRKLPAKDQAVIEGYIRELQNRGKNGR